MSSERQLQRQIYKLRLSPLLTPPRVLVLLSDIKGFNLKQQVRVNPESFLHFLVRIRGNSWQQATISERQFTTWASKWEFNNLVCMGRYV